MRLENKIAIVTGGAQGIGATICAAYAKEGATVIVADKKIELAQEVAQVIQANHGRAEAIFVDVTDKKAVKNLIDKVVNKFGKIDILLNAAGVYIKNLVEDCTEEEWNFTIDVNLKGSFLMAQAVVPAMKKQAYGKIICIASINASVALSGSVSYCASKFGVLGIVKAVAVELAQYNINVNALSPGFVATALNEKFRQDPGIVNFIQERTPRGQAYMKPDALIGAAVFLASDEADAVHGLDLIVDNGWTAV